MRTAPSTVIASRPLAAWQPRRPPASSIAGDSNLFLHAALPQATPRSAPIGANRPATGESETH